MEKQKLISQLCIIVKFLCILQAPFLLYLNFNTAYHSQKCYIGSKNNPDKPQKTFVFDFHVIKILLINGAPINALFFNHFIPGEFSFNWTCTCIQLPYICNALYLLRKCLVMEGLHLQVFPVPHCHKLDKECLMTLAILPCLTSIFVDDPPIHHT